MSTFKLQVQQICLSQIVFLEGAKCSTHDSLQTALAHMLCSQISTTKQNNNMCHLPTNTPLPPPPASALLFNTFINPAKNFRNCLDALLLPSPLVK